MGQVVRYDIGALQKPRRTPQGFLRVDGWASRVGVQEYLDHNGKVRRELRLKEDVFNPSSLQGFEGAPITDDHPTDMVSPSNWAQYAKGTIVGTGRQDGDHVAISAVVTDPGLIAKMESGKRQLSVGYTVEVEETPGEHPEFGHYDAIQRNVVVNHLAVVDRGRAGSARVRMDAMMMNAEGEHSKKCECDDCEKKRAATVTMDAFSKHANFIPELHDAKLVPHLKTTEPRMDLEQATARINELEAKLAVYEAKETEAKTQATKEMTEKVDSLTKKVSELEGQLVSATKDIESAKADAEKARKDAEETTVKARKDADDALAARVNERVAVMTSANEVLGAVDAEGKRVDRSALTDREIKLAVIKHVDGIDADVDAKGEKRHDAYVEALFDGALGRHSKGANAAANARVAATVVNTDAATIVAPTNPEEKAAADLKNSYANAWMTTTKKGE